MEVLIEKLDNLGRGICYVDKKITFVSNALPNESVEIEIIKSTKKYNEAVVKEYNNSSLDRVEVKCPYYNQCGGCNLLHLDYNKTLEYKTEKVKSILSKYAQINIDPSIVSSNNFNYRNKVTLKVQNYQVGYYQSKTHELVEINHCLLLEDAINSFLQDIKYLNVKDGEIVIRSNYNQELLIIITSLDVPNINFEYLKSKHKIAGFILNGKCLNGEDHFMDIVDNQFFLNGYESFFQVNRNINTEIFKYLKSLDIKGEVLLDLYCGVGTLGINLKNNYKRIYGIEVNADAIKNALQNKKINKASNINYMLGAVENSLDKINDNIDSVIIDPPRNGLDKRVIHYLIENKIKNIIYISCDPMTLARDLKLLKEYYNINQVKLFDMFPNTHHCESIAVLERK